MEKKRHYHYTKFSQEAILAAWTKMQSYLDKEQIKSISNTYAVELETEDWEHDTEAEFFTDYMKDPKYAKFVRNAAVVNVYEHF